MKLGGRLGRAPGQDVVSGRKLMASENGSNRKVRTITIVFLLIFLMFFAGTNPVLAINHYGGGTGTYDKTYSGIDLRGYHWICYCIDDWGGAVFGKNANLSEERYFEAQGTYPVHGPVLGYWENGTLESQQDIENLFTVLAKHPGMPLTPMFVMEFMNGTAMQANGFTKWVGIPINKTGWIEETKFNSSGPNSRGDPTAAYLDGYNRDLWLPELHGRTHADIDWLLQNCSEGNTTTIDCVVNHNTFPRIMNGTPYAGMFLPGNEYINNELLTVELGEGNKTVAQCQALLANSTAEFHNLFGYWPEASTPPGYGCSNNTLAAFRNTTIYGVGSLGNWKTPTYGNVAFVWTDYSCFNGISTIYPDFYMSSHYFTDLAMYMNYIRLYFSVGEPVVIQDHFPWYTCTEIRNITEPGGVADSLHFLDAFLSAIKTSYPDVWFLTAPELHQLNIRGYSIQNWTDKIVVRNALSTRNIDVPMPPGFLVDRLYASNSSSVNKTYTILNDHTVRINVPHNETFTLLKAPDLIANFSYIVHNRDVSFHDHSIASYTYNVSWDFGDGYNSTDINPTHTYYANGNYLVTMTIEDVLSSNLTITTITIDTPGGEVNSMMPVMIDIAGVVIVIVALGSFIIKPIGRMFKKFE